MSVFSLYEFISSQFAVHNLIWRDLSGKTVVVTGSNTGLGLEAARHFATMKPSKLILAVRDAKRGQVAADDIEFTGLKPEVWIVDFASFESVKKFAKKFNDSNERLDILVSNAAIGTSTWKKTSDGYEPSIQINHLSNMLLIHLLLPTLRKTASKFNAEPRVVVVSSGAHMATKYPEKELPDPIAALNDPARSDINERYNVSKLLNIFMVRQFSKMFSDNGDKISIHAINPGFCHSELTREAGGLVYIRFRLMKLLLAKTSEVGSRTLVHAAVSEELLLKNGPGGRYWDTCREMAPTLTALNGKFGATVWKESMGILQPHI